MVTIDFTGEHVRAATALARESYEEERRWVPALDKLLDLESFAENGLVRRIDQRILHHT